MRFESAYRSFEDNADRAIYSIALTPDGRQLAYAASDNGRGVDSSGSLDKWLDRPITQSFTGPLGHSYRILELTAENAHL